MMASGIDPVDLAQAAIGPGISVYSRYSQIREADGSNMPVQKALEIINNTLDDVLGDADTDYDADTRFAIKWYQSYGWEQKNSGIADQLSRSAGTSPENLARTGIFEASGGKARLLTLSELNGDWKPLRDDKTCLWEAAIRMAGILDAKGVDAVAPVMAGVGKRLPIDQVKALGFRMYHEAEKRKDTESAQVFNGLVSLWDDLAEASEREAQKEVHPEERFQGEFDMD
jgi:putative DNA methylase